MFLTQLFFFGKFDIFDFFSRVKNLSEKYFSNFKNIFEKLENIVENLKNIFEHLKNIFENVKDIFESLKNIFENSKISKSNFLLLSQNRPFSSPFFRKTNVSLKIIYFI